MIEKQSGIYCIENIVNHKKYIGQSINIEVRWKIHKRMLNNNHHYNKHLQSAWNAYGEKNFIFYVIEYCSIKQLDELEKNYISLYNTTSSSFGYNQKTGGQNGGSIYSDESRKNMSLSHKELLKNPKEIEKLRQNSLKTSKNKDYKDKRSGKNHPLYGKHLSNEWKQKISNGNKGKKKPPRSENHKKALSSSLLGHSPSNKNTTPVYCVESKQIYSDAITAGRTLKIKSPNHVIDVCMGRRKTCGGYHFKFINGENNIS